MEACPHPPFDDVIACGEPFGPTRRCGIIMNGALADDNISFSARSSRHIKVIEFA
jgi:hypothetical protein